MGIKCANGALSEIAGGLFFCPAHKKGRGKRRRRYGNVGLVRGCQVGRDTHEGAWRGTKPLSVFCIPQEWGQGVGTRGLTQTWWACLG